MGLIQSRRFALSLCVRDSLLVALKQLVAPELGCVPVAIRLYLERSNNAPVLKDWLSGLLLEVPGVQKKAVHGHLH